MNYQTFSQNPCMREKNHHHRHLCHLNFPFTWVLVTHGRCHFYDFWQALPQREKTKVSDQRTLKRRGRKASKLYLALVLLMLLVYPSEHCMWETKTEERERGTELTGENIHYVRDKDWRERTWHRVDRGKHSLRERQRLKRENVAQSWQGKTFIM